MNAFRSICLLVVLFAAYASACHGSQPPRRQMTGKGKMMPLNPMNPMKMKTEAEKDMEFNKFNADVKARMAQLQPLTRAAFLVEMKITEAQLKEYEETAKRLMDIDFQNFITIVNGN